MLDLDLESILTQEVPLTGDPRIPRALAGRYGRREEEVLPVLGTSMGLFLICAAVLGPGDGVLVEEPAYESLWRVPEVLGARVARFPRREEAGWALEPEAILREWAPDTRLVVVSDLHNPTGRMAGDQALAWLAEEAGRRGAWVLVDEVYRDFREGTVGTARELGEPIVAVSSLTKVYGLPGLRGGWILAPVSLVERMRSLVDLLYVIPPSPLEPMILAALERADDLRDEALARAARGWRVVEAWSRSREDPRIVPPHGGVMAWARLPRGWSGTAAAARLREEGVATVPGRFFGDDSGIRFGFGGSEDSLRAGLEALDRMLRGSPRPESPAA
jgi:aspartate/methionine/tyrosine aminotransferase